ncbi:hypothetical protein GCM10008090_12170 [Arenicella chitinivorans]|uniref:Cytochrome c family protein n=1 Tax=Arenicella chitinivorans TaxID=1329800 RepID=A0A918RNQ2_9GAMM|nr:hypothetical protein [Arenicella chitinivorans]GHA04380.1 hypothetical protein GCM10008090_12170 [Arenicella chitinivorans]
MWFGVLSALHVIDVLAQPPATSAPLDYQSIVVGPNLPPDVSLTQENRQRDMDTFSWQSFVALNWPTTQAGTPNYQSIIGATPTGDHEVVWDRWSATADIFDLAAGETPVWGEQFVPAQCRLNANYKPGMKVLVNVTKSQDFFEEAFNTGPLVDQSGHFTRYEIRINKPMFDTVVENALYTTAGQEAASIVSFSCGDNRTGEEGAVMLKAAWKPLSSEDDTSRYHAVPAMVFTPARYRSDGKDACELETVGLVGLHVVHKTVQQPQWIWSSFEHIDNVPECRDQNTFFTAPSALNTPTCPSQVTGEFSYFSNDGPTACNTAPPGNAGDNKFHLDQRGVPSRLCRANALETSAPPVNQAYQTLLKAINPASVWQYYQLIGTQWNANIQSTCSLNTDYVAENTLPQYKIKGSSSGPTPLPMANSTMEGYEQGSANCINCHAGAKLKIKPKGEAEAIPSDFVWFLNQEIDTE